MSGENRPEERAQKEHPGMAMNDPQVVEILGRNRLVNELLMAGLEVARPERDRGVDLIVYADRTPRVNAFIARPLQMKAAMKSSFALDAKYRLFPNLLLVYVWRLADPAQAVTYAMDYDEALSIAQEMGWLKTPSWLEKGIYSNTTPGRKLVALMEPYIMTPERWWARLPEAAPQQDKEVLIIG
jgi:hypothetical protein